MKKNVTVIILGGGQGKRLYPLTKYRSKPAVPIGGKYRLVDIPISNSINAGYRKIFVLTQFNSTSLHRHIHRTYPYESFNQTSVELLAAEQTLSTADWFQGTADAVRKHLNHYRMSPDETVLILSGDHLYRMDYKKIVQYHEDKGADVTIATLPVSKTEVSGFGIMQLNSNAKISSFLEKPSPKENIRSYVVPDPIRKVFNLKTRKDIYLASMGIYIFKASVLMDVLAGRETDFGKEVIPKAIDSHKVFGYVYDDYWEDIGTIRAFYRANLELTRPKAQFSFLDGQDRIFTRARFLPPSNLRDSKIKNAVLAEGSILEGAEIENSVVGLRSVIRRGTILRKAILMGNDFYEHEKPSNKIPLGIGRNCHIENCIIDKNVRIGNNVDIRNHKKVKEDEGDFYVIRDGIVIIPKGVTVPNRARI